MEHVLLVPVLLRSNTTLDCKLRWPLSALSVAAAAAAAAAAVAAAAAAASSSFALSARRLPRPRPNLHDSDDGDDGAHPAARQPAQHGLRFSPGA